MALQQPAACEAGALAPLYQKRERGAQLCVSLEDFLEKLYWKRPRSYEVLGTTRILGCPRVSRLFPITLLGLRICIRTPTRILLDFDLDLILILILILIWIWI